MFWPLVLTLAGLVAAYVPVLLGMADLPAIVAFLLMAGGAVWAWVAWSEEGGWKPALKASGLTLPLLLHGYWFFFFSAYDDPAGVPGLGTEAPAIAAVRVRDRASFDLRAQRGQSAVLVFFRGAW